MTSRRTSGAARLSTSASAAAGRRGRLFCFVLAAWALVQVPSKVEAAPAEDPPPTAVANTESLPVTKEVIPAEAEEADTNDHPPSSVTWNQFDFKLSTLRFGFGYLAEYDMFQQDRNSETQFGEIEDDYGMRDGRLLFSGRFKTKRPVSWTIGYMYDGSDGSWRFRQTGFTIEIPEVKSRVFVGRTKEGYSMVKAMVGYYGWTMERSPALDAFVPILADGVKWMYYSPERRIHWSLGLYIDSLSNREAFATYDSNAVGRLVWQPILSEADDEVLHLGVMARGGEPDDGFLRVRSKPEAYLAPFFLDAGRLESNWASGVGFEAFYRKNSWLIGSEYHWEQVDLVSGDSQLFHAGDVVATWILTGETRPYNASGGTFGMVPPETLGPQGRIRRLGSRPATELQRLRRRRGVPGGTFWRITPMINWYLNNQIRLEFVYGYGELDRFGTTGATQFYQTRLQFAL